MTERQLHQRRKRNTCGSDGARIPLKWDVGWSGGEGKGGEGVKSRNQSRDLESTHHLNTPQKCPTEDKYVNLLEITTATKDAIKVTLVTAFLPFLFADDVVLASEDTLL